jgi:hypothetical protein
MNKRNITPLVLSILVAIATFAAGSRFLYKQRLERNLPPIHEGLQESEVVGLLGQPHDVARPCWGKNPRCNFDYVYSMLFSVVGFALISFDNSGDVIGKEE